MNGLQRVAVSAYRVPHAARRPSCPAGIPHHVTQRGNRKYRTFFCDDDYAFYLALLRRGCHKAGTAVWAWCLMPNHVHLVLVPADKDGLRGALAAAHTRYAWEINRREGWHGHLWQDRFASFPMEDDHCHACLRYVELNPVRARLAGRPEDLALVERPRESRPGRRRPHRRCSDPGAGR
ncbi:MAG TPA: transposase [Allosphingosinicella sp.]|jgi:putative transposase